MSLVRLWKLAFALGLLLADVAIIVAAENGGKQKGSGLPNPPAGPPPAPGAVPGGSLAANMAANQVNPGKGANPLPPVKPPAIQPGVLRPPNYGQGMIQHQQQINANQAANQNAAAAPRNAAANQAPPAAPGQPHNYPTPGHNFPTPGHNYPTPQKQHNFPSPK